MKYCPTLTFNRKEGRERRGERGRVREREKGIPSQSKYHNFLLSINYYHLAITIRLGREKYNVHVVIKHVVE